MTTASEESTPALTDEAVQRFLIGLWRLNRRMQQDMSPILTQQNGLDLRRYFIMQAIAHGQNYPKQLSEKMDIPSTLLSRYLDGLNTQGYIERQIDREDSRRVRLSVTAEGQKALDECQTTILKHTSERLQKLNSQKMLALLDAIEILGDASELQE